MGRLCHKSERLGRYTHAAVAVDSVPCAGVGRAVLEQAGTAVDAAVAALLCNGVTTSQSAGLGGGFIMTVVLANGTRAALVARETAPAAATRTMFANRSSTLGPLAAGVPGELLGLWEAKQRFGNPDVPWTDLLDSYTIPEVTPANYSDLLIPNIGSIRTEFLIGAAARLGHNVLLTGEQVPSSLLSSSTMLSTRAQQRLP